MRGNDLDRLLQSRFGTGKRFTAAYLDYFTGSQGLPLKSPQDWAALDDTRRMWFEYALSTNGRGEDLMNLVERYRPLPGKRYLDVGCGFGGFLVAAAKRGAECVGLEIDPQRAGFSRENLADFDLNVPVYDLDALSPDLSARLGTFDIVTCNDVIEHVDSAERLLANLRRLLRPGGLACIEIPNGESIEFVARDGHFGLFGITLLDREHAKAYHWDRFHYPYDVGDYWTLDQYTQFFQRAGLRAELIESLYHPTRPFAELDDQLHALDRARIPDPALDQAYEAYRARLERDRRALPQDAFRHRYLRNFWTFMAATMESDAEPDDSRTGRARRKRD